MVSDIELILFGIVIVGIILVYTWKILEQCQNYISARNHMKTSIDSINEKIDAYIKVCPEGYRPIEKFRDDYYQYLQRKK